MGFTFGDEFKKRVDVEDEFDPGAMTDYTRDWDALGYNQGDAFSTAFMNESLTAQVLREGFEWTDAKFQKSIIDSRNAKDDTYDMYSDEWQEKLRSLTPDGLKLFNDYGAQNAYYGQVAFEAAQKHDLDQEYLQSQGLIGTGYRLIGALSDIPLVLAAAPESGGSSIGSWTYRTSRILNTNFARRALTGGTIEGIMELGRQKLSREQRDELDLVLAVGLGAISRGLFSKHPDHELARVGRELISDASKGLDITARLAKFTADAKERGVDGVVEKLQYDLASQSATSTSPTFREFADKMYYQRTGEGSLDREPGKMAGEETKDFIEQNLYNMVTQATRPLMMEIADLSKRGVFKHTRAHWDPRFQGTVNEIMGDLQLGKLFDPAGNTDNLIKNATARLMDDLGLSRTEASAMARKLLKATEDVSESSHDILRQAGSDMFLDPKFGIPKSKDYFPINHDSFKMADMIKSHGIKEMEAFFAKSISAAIKKRGMKVNTAKTRAVAKALVTKMAARDEMTMLTKMEKEDIKGLLQDVDGLSSADVDYISTLLSKPSKGEDAGLGSTKHEKTRGIFDYAITHTTKAGAKIGFKDIISNNFEGAWFPYARTQAGSNTLERLGLKTPKEKAAQRTKIKKELDEQATLGEITTGQAKRELSRYDETILELEGKPLASYNQYGRGAQALRISKNMNIARFLGQTFWTMSAELGSTTWNVGLRHMFRSIPMLGQLKKQFVTGKFDDDLMQELYTHFGLMGDFSRGIGYSKFEHDFANVPVGGIASKMDRFEKVSDQFKEAALMVGGIKPLTAYFEAATSSGLITKMMKAAHGQKIKGGFNTTLGEMGFTGKLRKDIFEQIRKHVITKDSKVFGKSMQKINIEAWDPAIRDAFIIGVKRHTNTIVQRATMGDKVGVMFGDKLMQHTIAGKLGLEMKGYVVNAWSKQLGRALTRRDLYSLGMFSTQMTLGALAYMAQVHTNYPHDARKRGELLQMDKIAKATFARSSMASWLPQLIDSGAVTGLYDKQFSHARSSGLASGIVQGAPIFDLLDTTVGLLGVPGAMMGLNDITPGAAKNAMRALPLHNVLGLRALMEGITSDVRSDRALQRQRGY